MSTTSDKGRSSIGRAWDHGTRNLGQGLLNCRSPGDLGGYIRGPALPRQTGCFLPVRIAFERWATTSRSTMRRPRMGSTLPTEAWDKGHQILCIVGATTRLRFPCAEQPRATRVVDRPSGGPSGVQPEGPDSRAAGVQFRLTLITAYVMVLWCCSLSETRTLSVSGSAKESGSSMRPFNEPRCENFSFWMQLKPWVTSGCRPGTGSRSSGAREPVNTASGSTSSGGSVSVGPRPVRKTSKSSITTERRVL